MTDVGKEESEKGGAEGGWGGWEGSSDGRRKDEREGIQ